MRLPGFLILIALISSPATAAEIKLLTDDGQNPLTHILEQESGAYTYYAAIGEDAKTVTLDAETAANVTAIEYANMTSWAVGEDGPWWPIPGSSTKPQWVPVPLTDMKEGTINVPVDDKNAHSVLTPATIKAAQKTMKADKDMLEPDRWIAQLDKCDGSDSSPCYDYVSERIYRYTLKSGDKITVVIHYPGGC